MRANSIQEIDKGPKTAGEAYSDAAQARLSVIGAEANLSAPLSAACGSLRLTSMSRTVGRSGTTAARLTISSHFLSSESIYLQYSHYIYGDKMVLAGQWPWGTPLVTGADIIQGGAYAGKPPDRDVLKLQASVTF